VVNALVSINEVNLRRVRISTGMGDRVPDSTSQCGKITIHPGQLSLAIPPWVLGRRNAYQPKGGDALRLESKGKAGMVHE